MSGLNHEVALYIAYSETKLCSYVTTGVSALLLSCFGTAHSRNHITYISFQDFNTVQE